MFICPAPILLTTFHIFWFTGEQFCAVPRRFCFGTFCPKVKARSISTGPQPMGSLRKPSEAVCVGRGGARERVPFSPQGGNGTKRTLRRRGFGEAPQQAFSQPRRDAKISSVATLELLAKTCVTGNPSQIEGGTYYTSTISLAFMLVFYFTIGI